MIIRLLPLLIYTLVTCAGCHKADGDNWLKTYPTTGKLTINSLPANGAVIRLYPVTPQADTLSPVIPTGIVQEDGSFELTSYRSGDGAPEGDYYVTFEWPDPKLLPPQLSTIEDPPDRLKNRYTTPDRSSLQVHIAAGENQLEPMVLEKVEILTSPSKK
jgi:hypothetical protein